MAPCREPSILSSAKTECQLGNRRSQRSELLGQPLEHEPLLTRFAIDSKVQVLGRVLRRPAFIPTPAFALRIIMGEFSSELLSSSRVLPEAAQKLGYAFQYPTLEQALRQALGK